MKRLALKLLLGAFLAFGVGFYLVPIFFPLPQELEKEVAPQGLLLVDRNGEPLRRFLDNPVAIERGLGVLLWSGLIVVLLTKSSL